MTNAPCCSSIAAVGTSANGRIDPSAAFIARVRYMPGCMQVGTGRPPLRSWIISNARSMAPQWSQWPCESTMTSTLAMSKPRRSTLRSNTATSGPVSNSSVCTTLRRQAVMAHEKPCAAQHMHCPDHSRRPLFHRRGNSFST
jgi:hypothetical protein